MMIRYLTAYFIVFFPALLRAQSVAMRDSAQQLVAQLKKPGLKDSDSLHLVVAQFNDRLGKMNFDSSEYYRSALLSEQSAISYGISNYARSVDEALQALSIARNLKQPRLTNAACYRLVAAYSKLGSTISQLVPLEEQKRYVQLSIQYAEMGIASAIETGDSSLVLQTRAAAINNYLAAADYERVLANSEQMLKQLKPDQHKLRSMTYNQAGIAWFEKGQMPKAQENFEASIREGQQSTGSLTLLSAMGNLANVYLKKGYHAQAKKLLHALVDSNLNRQRKQALSKNYITLSNLFKKENRFDSALHYYELYYLYRDSVFNEDSRKNLQALEEKFELAQREAEIKELQLLKTRNENQLQRKNLWITLIVSSAILIIGLFFFLSYRKMQQQRQARAEVQQRLLAAQMNPHFLFNALNSIQRLYVDGRIEEGNHFMSLFAQLVRDILEKTGRTRIPLHEELEFLEKYLSLERLRLHGKFDYHIEIDDELQESIVQVPSLILQPLAENAVLHGIAPKSEAGFIDIHISRTDDDHIKVVVQDDGVGLSNRSSFDAGRKQISRGLGLVRSRIGKGGLLSIQNIKGQNSGTIAILTIPI